MSADAAFETIRYEVDGAVATVTLARPDAANAQSSEMLTEIDRAPEDALNRILWRHVRGGSPYPEWAVTDAEEDDDDAEGGAGDD